MKQKLQKVGYGILIAYVILMSGYNFVFLPIVVPAIGQFVVAALSGREDGAIVYDGKFRINQIYGPYGFYFHENYPESTRPMKVILENVQTYTLASNSDKTRECFLVVSTDGYAVLDKNSLTCKVYLHPGVKDSIDYRAKIPKQKQVLYLSSFDDFAKDEQAILTELEENPSWVFQETQRGHYEKVKPKKKR